MKGTRQFSPGNKADSLCDLAELYLLGLLEPAELADFESHLQSGCKECLERLAADSETLAMLATQHPATPTPALRARLRAQLQLTQKTGPPAESSGTLLNRLGLLIKRPSAMEWERSPIEGVSHKILSVDEKRSYATKLVRFDPGAHYPAHRHAAVEEVYMLKGDLRFGEQMLLAGDYCRAETGTSHPGLFTQEGCLMLIVTSLYDQILT